MERQLDILSGHNAANSSAESAWPRITVAHTDQGFED